ncbi:hypothetical protein PS943_04195 [Pseudomonas fluorescens]|jgi:plasmid stabilization system protein ParE|uniref:Type II toxin-antitoxin system RelE/ParE family toxin n=1 Tax=Pseudomonas fluorescens TaxID=294 RepID=A0A5E7WK35_PSEFL|nr:hypothetical protein PS943_04195 [Pseudomonas fluorescens]
MLVEWRPEARAELWQIIDYIGDRHLVAASELYQAIEAATSAFRNILTFIDLVVCPVRGKLLCIPITWWSTG